MQIAAEAIGDLAKFADAAGLAIRMGAMRGAQRTRAAGKVQVRQDVRRAGLGDRLANTWRDQIYPSSGNPSWHPAVLFYSKAPVIISAFTDGATITRKPGEGVFLAIPTDKVPSRGRKPMTPVEVEATFDQDLIFRPSPSNPGVVLAFIDRTLRRRLATYRRKGGAAAGRNLPSAKEKNLVLMFVMVRQVTLRKRLHWPDLVSPLAALHLQNTAEEISRELRTL